MATAIDHNDLIKTVETVQERIKRYHDRLAQDEMVTRVALVDPILKVLGWDVANLDLVEVEHNYSSTRDDVDYALWNQPLLGEAGGPTPQKPAAFVEAKPLDDDLEYSERTEKHKRFKWQVDRYRYYTDYIVTTNGDLWRIYETAPADFNKCLLKELEFKTTEAEPHVCAQNLEHIANILRSNRPADNGLRWTSLSTVTQKGKEATYDFPHQEGSNQIRGWPSSAKFPPSAIQFPPTSINPKGQYRVSGWSELLKKTAVWLVEHGHLTRDQLPIYTFNSNPERKHLVTTEAGLSGYERIPGTDLFLWVGGGDYWKPSRGRKRNMKGMKKDHRKSNDKETKSSNTAQKSHRLMNAAHLLEECAQQREGVYIQAPP